MVINKEFSLTKIALIDLDADGNFIQEGIIPFKYHEKLFERLIQATGEKLIINYKIPNVHIRHDGICFEIVFVSVKDLPSKIILGTPIMALLYPFLVADEGIKTNVLGKDIFFRFILAPVLKENHSSKKVTILKDINEKRIYRTEKSLSSLKTKISLNDQLTENDKKKDKRDKETEIYSPIAFLHKHRHIVQIHCEKEFSGKDKDMKDGTVLSFSQYELIDSLTDVPNKINDMLTPFIVSLNTHITDVLITEVLTDSPLLIIKENINCGNFLNKDKFNFFTGKVNHKLLTNFSQTIKVRGVHGSS